LLRLGDNRRGEEAASDRNHETAAFEWERSDSGRIGHGLSLLESRGV